MTFLYALLTLCIIAGAFYLINRFIGNGLLKTVLEVVIGIILIVWLCSFLGILNPLNIHVGK